MLRAIAKTLFASRAWILSIAFLAAVWVVVESSQPFQECVEEIYYNPETNNFEKSIPSFSVAFDVYRTCLGHFTHDNAEAIIAAFTILLALSTIFLWVATRDLVRGAEKTAERQLRAYVFAYNGQVNVVQIGATKTLAYKLSIELRNFGQTPARRYTTWIDNTVTNVDDLPFTERPPLIDKKRSAPTIIGPTASITIEFSTPFEIGELDAIRDTKKAIFIWGGCDYVDVFGREHYFIFRFKISGHENQGIWRLRPHKIGEEGN